MVVLRQIEVLLSQGKGADLSTDSAQNAPCLNQSTSHAQPTCLIDIFGRKGYGLRQLPEPFLNPLFGKFLYFLRFIGRVRLFGRR